MLSCNSRFAANGSLTTPVTRTVPERDHWSLAKARRDRGEDAGHRPPLTRSQVKLIIFAVAGMRCWQGSGVRVQ
jgi:hypothetical protein